VEIEGQRIPTPRSRPRVSACPTNLPPIQQRADSDPDACGLGRRGDHFGGRRVADERAGASRWDLAQTNLQKAGQGESTDATRMDGDKEQVL
jgi:hypothetical protein